MMSRSPFKNVCVDARETFRNKTGIGVVARRLCDILEKSYGVVCIPADYASQSSPASLKRSKFELVVNLVRHIVWKQVYLPWVVATNGSRVILCPDPITPFLASKRVVIIVYDLMFYEYPELVNKWWGLYWRIVLPLSVRRAFRIIAISENTKRQVHCLLRVEPSKVQVAYLGYDRSMYHLRDTIDRSEILAKYNLPLRFILFVGAVEPRRNLETLLRALGRIKQTYDSAPPLAIVGAQTNHTAELKELAAACALDQIYYLGYVSENDLALLYNIASTYVYPSIAEGFGLTVLEAMASGCPVVCSNVDSLPEVAGEACLLIPPTDVDGFAEAIQRVWTQPDLARVLREKGLAQAARFSWERMAETVIQVCNEAL